ncbi:HNHc domain containing protein [uncultured Caudovirales phage]|uniref:HNHc domain containing protein n=1 Tax=uncultured Caudovirales phage TaxID=2100421 RepID=A0A6J5LH79_9CAUD|nr:HNHc domain containing protein [uncultured Caudovirales phage]
MALNGHKRMHGNSDGKISKVFCCCLITKEVITIQYLEQYQNRLIKCKHCDTFFNPIASKLTFCSRSCAASHNNKIYVKRQKIEKPPKVSKVRKTDEEKRAKNVSNVQAYRARKYGATLPDTDNKLIQQIYKMCPAGYEVDHTIALSEGGSHHQNNLQYLPAMENRKKNRTQNYDKTLVIKWQDVIK